MRTVIFDLDGTLADTSGDLIEAANACFRRRGLGDVLDHNRDALTAFHGGRAMLSLGYARGNLDPTTDEMDRDYRYLLEYYGKNIDAQTRLYPGTMDAIAALKDDGIRVGICTNKPEGLAHTLLSRLGVRDAFASLIGADTLPTRKPDAEPYQEAVKRTGGAVTRSVIVGDTETDSKTATAAGVPSILVTFGPAGADVARFSPDALLHRYEDLPQIVTDLLGPE